MITVQQAGGQKLPFTCGGSMVQYGVNGSPTSLYKWELPDSSDRFVTVNSDSLLSGDTLFTSDTLVQVLWSYKSQIHNIVFTRITIDTVTIPTIGTLTFDCIAASDTGSVLVNTPNINLPATVNICVDSFYVYSAPTGFTNYLWMNPNHDSTNSSSITVTQPGIYWVKVIDSLNCSRTDSSDLIVHQLPKVNIGQDTVLCHGTLTLDAGNAGSTYLWTQWLINDSTKTHETTQQFTVSDGGKIISVKVTDINSCSSSDTIKIFGCTANQILGFVPNTFTPNGDGQHDTWVIENLDLMPYINDITRVEIYDRWGRLIYQSALGKANNWNGTDDNHQPVPMGSYYYIFFVEGQKPVYGNITIIR